MFCWFWTCFVYWYGIIKRQLIMPTSIFFLLLSIFDGPFFLQNRSKKSRKNSQNRNSWFLERVVTAIVTLVFSWFQSLHVRPNISSKYFMEAMTRKWLLVMNNIQQKKLVFQRRKLDLTYDFDFKRAELFCLKMLAFDWFTWKFKWSHP